MNLNLTTKIYTQKNIFVHAWFSIQLSHHLPFHFRLVLFLWYFRKRSCHEVGDYYSYKKKFRIQVQMFNMW